MFKIITFYLIFHLIIVFLNKLIDIGQKLILIIRSNINNLGYMNNLNFISLLSKNINIFPSFQTILI